jgi:chromosome partitioning protein
MEWQDALTGANLIWTTLGIALGGLSGAFIGGWSISSFLDGRRLRRMKEDVAGLARDAASKDAKIQALEAAIAVVPPQAQNLLDPIDLSALGAKWWLKKPTDEDSALMRTPRRPEVLVVANLKGGVAKTMLSANLAAYFATRGDFPSTKSLSNRRVLLIDLDYQGSLSEMAANAMKHPITAPDIDAKVETLFQSERFDEAAAFQHRIHPGPGAARISLYPADYGFDDFEFRTVSDWLAGKTGDDVRFRLLRRLSAPQFVESFDLVIIDTGPRLTLGSVAALTAATHLIVPSAPDRRSIEAADRFLNRVATMREDGVTNLKCCGVVATLVSSYHKDTSLPFMRKRFSSAFAERPGFSWLTGALPGDRRGIVLNAEMPFSVPIQQQAATGIPYLEDSRTRQIMNSIGKEIEERLS